MSKDAEGPGPVVHRLAALFPVVAKALASGLVVSEEIHAAYGWNVAADKHLAYQLVRRVAVDWLKPHTQASGEAASLGLPMSGLVIRPKSGDVIRVWHSNDGSLPRVDTEAMRMFCSQRPIDQETLFPEVHQGAGSNLAIVWNAKGPDLTRFDLVRPAGASGPIAHVDWRVNLLGRLASDPGAKPEDPDIDDDDPE